MDKNNEYAGVEDKFVPESEKYESEDKTKSRETEKKVKKAVLIGYICFASIIVIFMIFMFVFVFRIFNISFCIFNKNFNNADKIIN